MGYCDSSFFRSLFTRDRKRFVSYLWTHARFRSKQMGAFTPGTQDETPSTPFPLISARVGLYSWPRRVDFSSSSRWEEKRLRERCIFTWSGVLLQISSSLLPLSGPQDFFGFPCIYWTWIKRHQNFIRRILLRVIPLRDWEDRKTDRQTGSISPLSPYLAPNDNATFNCD